jgi:hypothetical protein
MTSQPISPKAKGSNRKKITKKEQFFSQMERVVPWEEIMAIISPFYHSDRNKHGGRRRIPLEKILRMYLIDLLHKKILDIVFEKNHLKCLNTITNLKDEEFRLRN